MSRPDQALLRDWTKEGNNQAFTELALRHQDGIYRIGLRLLGNPAVAEDVAQECLVKLAFRGTQVECSVGGWLRSVAGREAIDHIRRQGRRVRRERAYQALQPIAAHPRHDDIRDMLMAAMKALPQATRNAITAHYYEGRTYQDIAEEGGVTRTTVIKRVSRGLERVRAYLECRGVAIEQVL